MSEQKKRYYGKYRGLVLNPVDLEFKGKVLASVTVGGLPLQVQAEACTPYAGPGVGFYAIPPLGAGVWIEFEEGDLDKPIWSGCWWNEGEVLAVLTPDISPPPTPASAASLVVLRTQTARLKLSTLTGEATLESLLPPGNPAMPTAVHVTPIMIEITFGLNTIRITPAGIMLNNTALVVLPG
ncbi:MAG: phage baseplate assembly protein V [Chloroflexia bacterium]